MFQCHASFKYGRNCLFTSAEGREEEGGKDPSGEFYAVLNLALRRRVEPGVILQTQNYFEIIRASRGHEQ